MLLSVATSTGVNICVKQRFQELKAYLSFQVRFFVFMALFACILLQFMV